MQFLYCCADKNKVSKTIITYFKFIIFKINVQVLNVFLVVLLACKSSDHNTVCMNCGRASYQKTCIYSVLYNSNKKLGKIPSAFSNQL